MIKIIEPERQGQRRRDGGREEGGEGRREGDKREVRINKTSEIIRVPMVYTPV